MNKEMTTALTTIGIAQLLKVPLNKQANGTWNWRSVFESGNMPSSHSAGVTALATYIGLKKGFKTVDFALAAVFGMIVMYDAQGIRRQAGELTIKVNHLDEEVDKLAGHESHSAHEEEDRKLKEMLGHQPQEVLGGAILGAFTGAISYFLNEK
ncbi:haloperoxidase [Alkalihalophilus pseudofirmus]|uniref:divergent PAP2 family protein n=1 Tax=Alkalihalobacterium alkalinitrilicum TaxID=427920 RepID=UPI00094C3A05|nr:divergent PAP2 family protein [Alkalihalobacterium alkalinitrilicum]OLO40358.1 haloperoxidase [Alkalihalophilus pseudofirmus]